LPLIARVSRYCIIIIVRADSAAAAEPAARAGALAIDLPATAMGVLPAGQQASGSDDGGSEQRQQAEWAANALTDAEWESFQRDGYLRLPPVPPALIGRASAAAHQLVAEKASSGDGRTKITGLIGREVPDGEAFMDLVDCPTTFPKGMSR
jgi:hypothetical protein